MSYRRIARAPTPTFRLSAIMCGSKGCLGALGVVVALLATLAARPELILPHKIHAAVRESPHRPTPAAL